MEWNVNVNGTWNGIRSVLKTPLKLKLKDNYVTMLTFN